MWIHSCLTDRKEAQTLDLGHPWKLSGRSQGDVGQGVSAIADAFMGSQLLQPTVPIDSYLPGSR